MNWYLKWKLCLPMSSSCRTAKLSITELIVVVVISCRLSCQDAMSLVFLTAKDHSKMLRVAQAGITGFMQNPPTASVVQADIRATKQRMLNMKVEIVG